MCVALSRTLAPFWAGYGGGRQGFMCCEVPPEELQQPTTNFATVIIEQGHLSEEEVEEEFKDLVDENRDWQVRQLSPSYFAVIFSLQREPEDCHPRWRLDPPYQQTQSPDHGPSGRPPGLGNLGGDLGPPHWSAFASQTC
jgi:hypothetical protein